MAPGDLSTKQEEDSWAWVEIGVPFPDGPVRVKGEQNQYVALWYKHGKPVCGRASNEGGVVECSFPFVLGAQKAELTGKAKLGGQIQILAYETWKDEYEVWQKTGFTYRWVPWKDRNEPYQQLVRCGKVVPILLKGDDGETYSGNLDTETETVTISHHGKVEVKTTGVGELLTIVRDLRDPRPPPPKAEEPPPPVVLEVFDVWTDLKEKDDFSRVRGPVMALGRPLNTPTGKKEFFVALWYKHGQPVSGNIYDNEGKIGANFVANGVEHTSKVGNLQVLAYSDKTSGFKLSWQTYTVATTKGSGWWGVRVKDTAPCVIKRGEFEYLGKVQLSEEKASYGVGDGKEMIVTGKDVKGFMVLCRDSPVPGAKYD